jgi:hypothetical protein
MAVCANQLALCDLFEDHSSTVPLNESGYIREFLDSRKVIPAHRRVVKNVTTVRAGSSALEFAIPLNELAMTLTLLRDP